MSNVGNRKAGWILVVLGIFFILQYLLDWEFYWAIVLIAVGGVLLIYALVTRHQGGIFPGTFLFLMGLLFLLMETGIIDDSMSRTWPLILIFIGVSFVMVFLMSHDDWGVLIPGGILLVLGIVFLLRNYRFISWGAVGDVLQWWPLILVAIGIRLLFAKRSIDDGSHTD